MIFHRTYMKNVLPFKFCLNLVVLVLLFTANNLHAQDEKQAEIKLYLTQNDTENFCTAQVISEGRPVKGTEVHFYVKRMFSLLPIGSAVETDDSGKAVMNYPTDLPGNKNGIFTVVAQIEDDDNFGTVESHADVKWGSDLWKTESEWGQRSLSASREKAPTFLMMTSNIIIAIIWGTLVFLVIQIFRIRSKSSIIKKTS